MPVYNSYLLNRKIDFANVNIYKLIYNIRFALACKEGSDIISLLLSSKLDNKSES